MSVINSVLRDLDSRTDAFTPLDMGAVSDLVDKPARSHYYWIAALLLVLLVGIVFYALSHFNREQFVAPDTSTISTQHAVSKVQQEVAEVIAGEPAGHSLSDSATKQITGLQISETSGFMQLEFQLSEFAPSYLKQRSNNRYVFAIKGVKNSIETPAISDNPWLKQVQISAIDESLEIRFDTQSGVLVDTQERRDQSSYYWIIRLKKNLQPVQSDKVPVLSDNISSKATSEPVSQPQSEAETAISAAPEQPAQPSPVKLQIRAVSHQSNDRMKLERAISSARQGDQVVAIDALQQLLGGELDREARIHLLSILSEADDHAAYVSMLDDALEKYPNDPVFQLYEANRLFSEKQYLVLIDRFKTVTDNPQMIALLATSYQRIEEHQLASEYFSLALKMNSQQPRLWISLAISRQHLAQSEQALHAYQMALRSGPLTSRLQEFAQSKIRQLSN